MSQYFPPYGSSGKVIKVELDLNNYTTKKVLEDITYADTSSFASKTNLANLKTEVDKIDTDKLKTVPDDLAKLSNVVKMMLLKTQYNALKTNVDAVDTSNYVSRTKYEMDGVNFEDKLTKIEGKIPDISDIAKKSSISALLLTSTFNSKVTELENKITAVDNKIPSTTGLATKTELTAVENKIPKVTEFVKKKRLCYRNCIDKK